MLLTTELLSALVYYDQSVMRSASTLTSQLEDSSLVAKDLNLTSIITSVVGDATEYWAPYRNLRSGNVFRS